MEEEDPGQVAEEGWKGENEGHLRKLCKLSKGEWRGVADMGSLRHRLKPRVLPTTSYRGEMEVTQACSIKVCLRGVPPLCLYSATIEPSKVLTSHPFPPFPSPPFPPSPDLDLQENCPAALPVSRPLLGQSASWRHHSHPPSEDRAGVQTRIPRHVTPHAGR